MLGDSEGQMLGGDLLLHAIIHGNTQDALALLEEGEAHCNFANINQQTPLHFAVDREHLTFVQILLKFGADPNMQEVMEVGGCTPLHRSCKNNQIEITRELLAHGADPSITAKNGFTALHYAAFNGHKEICKLLLSRGMDANLRDKYGYNPSYWAKENGHIDLLTILPPALQISGKDFHEFRQEVKKHLGVDDSKKKKKGKKGKKGKKK